MLAAEICQEHFPKADEILAVWFQDKCDKYVAANVSGVCGLGQSESLVALCLVAPESIAYPVDSLGLVEFLRQKYRALGMVLDLTDGQVEQQQLLASAIRGWP